MKALLLVAMVLVGLGAAAQQRQMKLEELQTALGLSAEQTVAVEEILTEQTRKGRAAAREARAADRQAMRERRRAMREETKMRIAAVLDEDQKAKYQELLADMAGNRDRGEGNAGRDR